MNRLTELANKHTTDKGTEHYEAHGYTEIYGDLIPSKGKFTLLEIGIWHGDSIRMWREYNPEMEIHAIDIDSGVLNHIQSGDGITIHIGDATNKEFLDSVIEKCGAPMYIIDDGSHRHSDIVATFDILYPKLAPKGVYFIEDLHAAHAEKEKTIEEVKKMMHPEDLYGTYNGGKMMFILNRFIEFVN